MKILKLGIWLLTLMVCIATSSGGPDIRVQAENLEISCFKLENLDPCTDFEPLALISKFSDYTEDSEGMNIEKLSNNSWLVTLPEDYIYDRDQYVPSDKGTVTTDYYYRLVTSWPSIVNQANDSSLPTWASIESSDSLTFVNIDSNYLYASSETYHLEGRNEFITITTRTE